jgi:monoamine oxidase
MKTSVAILGGGLSGLYAAHCLQKAGVDFQLLEARERFGGRILTADQAGRWSADGFDLGPSWFWPDMHPRMAGIVRDLKLQAFPQYSGGDVVIERSLLEAPRRFPGLRQEPVSMRFAGGTGAIVSALLDCLPQDRLHLETLITGLEIIETGVALRVRRQDQIRRVEALQAILALPPRLAGSTMSFTPELEPGTLDLWRRTATWMAPHAKFFALYDQPFWREAGLSGTAQSRVGPLVEIHDATTESGAAALFGFIGLGRAQREAAGDDRITAASIAQLARLFGARAAQPRATLLKDWTADPLTATGDDQTAEGHPEPHHRPWVNGPWAARLSLAGSETSLTDPGYLAGALDAGERAAGEVLNRLRTMPRQDGAA